MTKSDISRNSKGVIDTGITLNTDSLINRNLLKKGDMDAKIAFYFEYYIFFAF